MREGTRHLMSIRMSERQVTGGARYFGFFLGFCRASKSVRITIRFFLYPIEVSWMFCQLESSDVFLLDLKGAHFRELHEYLDEVSRFLAECLSRLCSKFPLVVFQNFIQLLIGQYGPNDFHFKRPQTSLSSIKLWSCSDSS